jgi:hypothetical protein
MDIKTGEENIYERRNEECGNENEKTPMEPKKYERKTENKKERNEHGTR